MSVRAFARASRASRENSGGLFTSCDPRSRTAPKSLTIGRLAVSTARVFNNLLSPIVGLAEMGLLETRPGDALHGDLEQILATAMQANELSRQLMAFGRRQHLKMSTVRLNDVVRRSEKLLRRLLREDIEVTLEFHPSLDEVRGDNVQLQQVLLSLALNARDAMPRGGRLTIETANVVLDAKQVSSEEGVEPGPFVMLAVSDTGYGMDDTMLSRVFEPFFTTKAYGQGMGLATAYGVVKQHGGIICLFSEPGQGTTVKVCLPRLEAARPQSKNLTPAPAGEPVGDETILVVEDEAIVKRMVTRVLRKHGYQVLTASDGVEAIELAKAHDGPIDLMLTDVIMPRMNGRELRDEMRTIRPDTKVVFMSGYTDSVIAKQGVLDRGTPFLAKPFSVGMLASKVRETLDDHPDDDATGGR